MYIIINILDAYLSFVRNLSGCAMQILGTDMDIQNDKWFDQLIICGQVNGKPASHCCIG